MNHMTVLALIGALFIVWVVIAYAHESAHARVFDEYGNGTMAICLIGWHYETGSPAYAIANPMYEDDTRLIVVNRKNAEVDWK